MTLQRAPLYDDRRLVESIRRGEPGAIDELIRRHYARVYGLALRLTGNNDDAQDLVSETFIRAYKSIAEFRGECYVSTWLYSITRNVFLSHCKREKGKERESLDQFMALPDSEVRREPADPHPGPEAAAESSEFAAEVQAAVHRLPETQRMMIVLYHFQHLSYAEIATIMALPVGTVKSRINRARLALRGMLRRTLTPL